MAAQAAFIACGLGAVGLILILVGALSFRQAWDSSRWPSTAGEIIESCVNCRSDGDVPGARYQARVLYRYEVGGKEYTGWRLSFREATNPTSTRPDQAAELVNRYPVGKRVTVFYDAQEPTYAVLEPGAGMPAYAPMVTGGLFVVIGLIVFLLVLA